MISVKNVHFAYDGKPVLLGVDLEVKRGEIAALLGPNGSGKTTLLRCIFRILKPKTGCTYIEGKDLGELSRREIAKLLAGVPQNHTATFPYRVIDFVVMGRTPYLDIFSAPSTKDYREAWNILRELGIGHLAERPYTQLSGGERQLALIGRALMQGVNILLLDEPTKHLDVRNKVRVLTILRKLSSEKGLTVLMTLHDPNEAIMFADKVALIRDGKIIGFKPSRMIDESDLKDIYGIPFKAVGEGSFRVFIPAV